MKTLIETSLIGALLMTLAGCGSSGSGSDSDADMVADPAPGGVEAIFRAKRDDEPAALVNAEALGGEIDRLFGKANAEALSLEDGDGIVDVLNRARSG